MKVSATRLSCPEARRVGQGFDFHNYDSTPGGYCAPMPARRINHELARLLGARIRQLREEVGLTQERLAWECELSKGYLRNGQGTTRSLWCGKERRVGCQAASSRPTEQAGTVQVILGQFLSRAESGKHVPAIEILDRLAGRLGCELADLFVLDLQRPRLNLLEAARLRDVQNFQRIPSEIGLGAV